MRMEEGNPQLCQQPCVSEKNTVASLARKNTSSSPPPHTPKSTHSSESSSIQSSMASSGSKSSARSSSSSQSSSCDPPTSNLDSVPQKLSSWESREETLVPPRRRSPPSPPRSLFPPPLSHQSYRRNWEDDFPLHKSHWDLQRSPYTLPPPLTLHRRLHRPIPPPPEWRYGPPPRHRRGSPYELPPLELRHRWAEDDVYYRPNRYF